MVNIETGDAAMKAAYPAFEGSRRAEAARLGAKRLLDIALASLTIIAFVPVLALAAIVIALDSPGPILF